MRGVIREEECSLHGLTLRLQYKQVKNLGLRVKADGSVFVTVPLGLSDRELLSFLQAKEGWLRDKVQLQTQQEQQGQYHMGDLPYDGQHMWLWGKQLTAKFFIDKRKTGSYEVTSDSVCFYYNEQLSEEGRRAFVRFCYKEETYDKGYDMVQEWRKKMGVYPNLKELKVRVMKTRWGSCNVRTGAINLNALLACWPRECLEYVVVHELAHLLEDNHSPRFHAIVGSYLPNWTERDRILKSFSPV